MFCTLRIYKIPNDAFTTIVVYCSFEFLKEQQQWRWWLVLQKKSGQAASMHNKEIVLCLWLMFLFSFSYGLFGKCLEYPSYRWRVVCWCCAFDLGKIIAVAAIVPTERHWFDWFWLICLHLPAHKHSCKHNAIEYMPHAYTWRTWKLFIGCQKIANHYTHSNVRSLTLFDTQTHTHTCMHALVECA